MLKRSGTRPLQEHMFWAWQRGAREVLKAQNDIHPPDHDSWSDYRNGIMETLERWGMDLDTALSLARSKGYIDLYCLLLA